MAKTLAQIREKWEPAKASVVTHFRPRAGTAVTVLVEVEAGRQYWTVVRYFTLGREREWVTSVDAKHTDAGEAFRELGRVLNYG